MICSYRYFRNKKINFNYCKMGNDYSHLKSRLFIISEAEVRKISKMFVIRYEVSKNSS